MNTIPQGVPINDIQVAIPQSQPSGEDSGGGFMSALQDAMGQVEQAQAEAQNKISGVATASAADLHGAVIAVEKADLSFQLMMQVRNKIVSAYQEISRMQF
jgi:flagellar hook-basal body complex protein FliE